MAIVVEQERSVAKSSIVSLMVWLVILGIIIAAIYYIFFRNPEAIELVLPKNTTALSAINFNTTAITRAGSLQEYIPQTPPAPLGRNNPFIAL